MNVSVVLFTSDLRLHDQPALRAAAEAREVVPLFVRDRGVMDAGFAVPNRLAFLADCLRDLDAGLRERAAGWCSGPATSSTRCARWPPRPTPTRCTWRRTSAPTPAGASSGCGGRWRRRGRRLHVHDTVTTAVAPGAVTPASSDHFAVFTPYFRQWSGQHLRPALTAPRTVRVPDGVGSEELPDRPGAEELSPGLATGGETNGRRLLARWLRDGIVSYEDLHDALAADSTSHLSPHLHFGTLSPVELVHRARQSGGPGAEAFVRQLAWRDFHRQVLAARPSAASADYRTKHDRWRSERSAREDIAAWKEGRTGYPRSTRRCAN